MTENGRWKIILKYTLGLVALAVAVTLAIFLPEWYSGWQDDRQMDQATFVSRESIRFLDMDSLDIVGRLKILQEAEAEQVECYWASTDFYSYSRNEIVTEEDIVERCSDLVRLWIDRGIFPNECESWVDPDGGALINMLMPYVIYVGRTVLPVYVLQWLSPDETDCMTVVMDAELDMIYYASVSGTDIMENMAEGMGYASLDDMQKRLMAGEPMNQLADPNVAITGFADVCGAESAEVEGYNDNWLELNIALAFDNFEGHAFRRIVKTNSGLGYALMYGNDSWNNFVWDVMLQFGMEEYQLIGMYLGDYFMEATESYSKEENYDADEKTMILE